MTKKELRAKVAEAVKNLSEDYCHEADAAICRHVINSPMYRKARTIFCYVGNAREIDTFPLLRAALADGKIVATPLCTGKGIMEARQIQGLGDLVSGKFDILAPKLDTLNVYGFEYTGYTGRISDIMSYYTGEGFMHVKDGKPDLMATEQCFYALVAYKRAQNGESALYDMSDVICPGETGVPHEPSAVLPEKKSAAQTIAELAGMVYKMMLSVLVP